MLDTRRGLYLWTIFFKREKLWLFFLLLLLLLFRREWLSRRRPVNFPSACDSKESVLLQKDKFDDLSSPRHGPPYCLHPKTFNLDVCVNILRRTRVFGDSGMSHPILERPTRNSRDKREREFPVNTNLLRRHRVSTGLDRIPWEGSVCSAYGAFQTVSLFSIDWKREWNPVDVEQNKHNALHLMALKSYRKTSRCSSTIMNRCSASACSFFPQEVTSSERYD